MQAAPPPLLPEHCLKDEAFKLALLCIEHPLVLALDHGAEGLEDLAAAGAFASARLAASPGSLSTSSSSSSSSSSASNATATTTSTTSTATTSSASSSAPISATPSPTTAAGTGSLVGSSGSATSPVASVLAASAAAAAAVVGGATAQASTLSAWGLCCPFLSASNITNVADIRDRLVSDLQRACGIRYAHVAIRHCLPACLLSIDCSFARPNTFIPFDWFDWIRFDSIRFDSIRFDWIRFDSIRFGWLYSPLDCSKYQQQIRDEAAVHGDAKMKLRLLRLRAERLITDQHPFYNSSAYTVRERKFASAADAPSISSPILTQ